MTEGYWVIRTYEAGPVGEKTKYWVPGARPTRRSKAKEKTAIEKAEKNEYSTMKNMARLINANFAHGDLLLGLDYSPEGMEKLEAYCKRKGIEGMEAIREAAEHELNLCLRRVKRELAKQEKPIRYIAITSDMDGDTGEAVRVHHHLIVSAEVGEIFVQKWKLGGVAWSQLSDQDDYTPIAEYFIRQVRHIPDHRKFIASQNLVRPQPKDRIAASDAEIRFPNGSTPVLRAEFKPGRPQYIKYILPEDKKQRAIETRQKIRGVAA